MTKIVFADLGVQPIPNNFLREDELGDSEPFYPLRASLDTETRLVQLDFPLKREAIFNENYPYFSSQSATFLKHAETYANEMIARFHPKFVIEVGSNDGYLLQYFDARGVKVHGIEPCLSVASAARKKGISTDIGFFSKAMGLEWGPRVGERGSDRQFCGEMYQKPPPVDLMIANNVLAHVPDLDDFVSGFREALAPEGVATFEFPHLLKLIEGNQFDTIYHEHYSYLSLMAVERLLARNGLHVFDVDRLPVHGGSLRVFACHKKWDHPGTSKVADVILAECRAGLDRDEIYESFAEKVRATKRDLLQTLINIKSRGKTIVGYGAPAKGNTLLNYCGIGSDFLDFVVDTTPAKQGMYLPGTHLEVKQPVELDLFQPNYVLILPWNFKDEIMGKLGHIRKWGGKFIVPIPHPEIIS